VYVGQGNGNLVTALLCDGATTGVQLGPSALTNIVILKVQGTTGVSAAAGSSGNIFIGDLRDTSTAYSDSGQNYFLTSSTLPWKAPSVISAVGAGLNRISLSTSLLSRSITFDCSTGSLFEVTLNASCTNAALRISGGNRDPRVEVSRLSA